MSNTRQCRDIFHLPHLNSRRGMARFKQMVRPKVQGHLREDVTWFQNQYENYLKIIKVYQAHGIPADEWRFQVVQYGITDSLEIPQGLFVGRNDVTLMATGNPWAGQHGCNVVFSATNYGTAIIDHSQFNPNALHFGDHDRGTYASPVSSQFEPNSIHYGYNLGIKSFHRASALNPNAQSFRPHHASTKSQTAAVPPTPANPARTLSNPFHQAAAPCAGFANSPVRQSQSSRQVPSVQLPQATNTSRAPDGLSADALGEQPLRHTETPATTPRSQIKTIAAQHSQLGLIPHRAQSHQAGNNSPLVSFQASSAFVLPQSGYLKSRSGKYISPHRQGHLRHTSDDSIDSGYALRATSLTQSEHIVSPTPKSRTVTSALAGLEGAASYSSGVDIDPTTTSRQQPPGAPAIPNRSQDAATNRGDDFAFRAHRPPVASPSQSGNDAQTPRPSVWEMEDDYSLKYFFKFGVPAASPSMFQKAPHRQDPIRTAPATPLPNGSPTAGLCPTRSNETNSNLTLGGSSLRQQATTVPAYSDIPLGKGVWSWRVLMPPGLVVPQSPATGNFRRSGPTQDESSSRRPRSPVPAISSRSSNQSQQSPSHQCNGPNAESQHHAGAKGGRGIKFYYKLTLFEPIQKLRKTRLNSTIPSGTSEPSMKQAFFPANTKKSVNHGSKTFSEPELDPS